MNKAMERKSNVLWTTQRNKWFKPTTVLSIGGVKPFSATYHLQMNTLLRENRLEDVVDKRCKDADIETVEAVLEIAGRCTDAIRDDQPSMNQVPHLLEQRGHVTFA